MHYTTWHPDGSACGLLRWSRLLFTWFHIVDICHSKWWTQYLLLYIPFCIEYWIRFWIVYMTTTYYIAKNLFYKHYSIVNDNNHYSIISDKATSNSFKKYLKHTSTVATVVAALLLFFISLQTLFKVVSSL